ncbi:hypothetical protein HDE_03461 [Halotydeus destructor]|nr:hypothetical protein HDE_03461 [Halotydeus destructor]
MSGRGRWNQFNPSRGRGGAGTGRGGAGNDRGRPSGAPATSRQPSGNRGVSSQPFVVNKALGGAVRFVATDPRSQLSDPRTWPQLNTSLLSPECEEMTGRIGSYDGKLSWFLDGRKHCIDVCQERDRWFPTSRFYNKIRQGICYAYAVNRDYAKKENEKEIPATLDQVVWRRDRDHSTADQLNYDYGYIPVDRNVRSVPGEPAVRLNAGNSKRLTARLNLVVVQASDQALTVVQGEQGCLYLVAKGAANFATGTGIPAGQGYNSPKRVRLDPGEGVDVNGLRLERALFETGRLCRRANILARSLESFHDARMWTLSRDQVHDSQFTVTILDIGVRGRSSPHRDLGWENHPEEQYHAEMDKVNKVRLFVALIPDSLDRKKELINVVLLQDVHPVDGELHIIYLIHHRGSYYSHPVYENVKLVDVDLSGDAEWACFNGHINPLLSDREVQPAGGFSALEPLNEGVGCGQDVNEQRWVSLRLRGYHNEFWKRVVEPARAGAGSEQEALFNRWQPFFLHDFSGRQYLAEPLGNFKPEEIHVVNMAQLLTVCDEATDIPRINERLNNTSRVFLSGIGSGFNSGTESTQVRIFTYMVQVEVPDDKIRCVIYDFAGMETTKSKFFDPNAERETLGYFRYLNTLPFNQSEPPVPFVTGVDTEGRVRNREQASYQETSQQETNLVNIHCPVAMPDPWDARRVFQFKGTFKEMHFHFVSSVDIEDKVKVGVANLPLSCRAFTVHSRNMCEKLIDRVPSDVAEAYLESWQPNSRIVAKLHVRGAVWDDNDNKKVVGFMDSYPRSLVVMRPLFHRSSQDDPRHHQVVLFNQRFKRDNDYWIDDLDANSSVHVASFAFKYTEGNEITVGDMAHSLRSISSPVFDLVKGYPVQGFYRQFQLTALGHDEIHVVVNEKFEEIFNRPGRSGPPPGPYRGGQGGGSQGGRGQGGSGQGGRGQGGRGQGGRGQGGRGQGGRGQGSRGQGSRGQGSRGRGYGSDNRHQYSPKRYATEHGSSSASITLSVVSILSAMAAIQLYL